MGLRGYFGIGITAIALAALPGALQGKVAPPINLATSLRIGSTRPVCCLARFCSHFKFVRAALVLLRVQALRDRGYVTVILEWA